MAEITQQTTSKKPGVTKGKKLSTKVDLTPMVDLGFLLITFFIFTTSMASPKAMKLVMPDDRDVKDSVEASADKTLTLLIGSNDHIFYYAGFFKGTVSPVTLKDFRELVIDKKKELIRGGKTPAIVVLIKATDAASYKNVVDCLDEMTINDISSYMLLEPNDEELTVLKHFE